MASSAAKTMVLRRPNLSEMLRSKYGQQAPMLATATDRPVVRCASAHVVLQVRWGYRSWVPWLKDVNAGHQQDDEEKDGQIADEDGQRELGFFWVRPASRSASQAGDSSTL